jgi:hypothetical protein
VVGQGPNGWRLQGLTDNFIRVSAWAPEDWRNRITPVRVCAVTENGVEGCLAG